MKKQYLAFLFFWASLFIAADTSAQLHIVKDNIACLYGLKNDKGEWVMPAKFQQMQQLPNHFFTTVVSNMTGLINPEGREIASPQYDQITVFEPQPGFASMPPGKANNLYRFQLRKEDRYGLINGEGKILYPVKYKIIAADGGQCIVLQGDDNNCSYINASGETLFMMKNVYFFPFLGKNITRFTSTENHFSGVISQSGKIILPARFHAITICTGTNMIAVMEKDKTGYYDMTGKELLAPRYRFNSGYSSGELPCIHPGSGPLEVYNDTAWGILGGDLRMITPCRYDEIVREYGDFQLPEFFWRVRFKKGWGTLNTEGREVIAPVYDTLLRLADIREKYGEPRELKKLFFLARKNGKWGLLDSKGKILVPLVYDQFFSDWHHGITRLSLVFTQGTTLVTYNYGEEQFPAPKKITPVSRINDTVLVYRLQPEGLSVFTTSKKNPEVINANRMQYPLSLEPYNNIWLLRYTGGAYLLRKNGTIWMGKNQVSGVYEQCSNLVIATPSGKIGLINSRDAKLLVDTVYETIACSGAGETNGYFWVKPKKINCRANPNGQQCWCGWMLIDSAGKQITPPDFAEPVPDFFRADVHTLMTNDGAGLYSGKEKRFVLAPRYKNIMRFEKNLFQVFTWGNRFGFTDSTGKWLTDTLWNKDMMFLDQWETKPKSYATPQLGYRQWLLTGKNITAVIDSKGVLITDATAIKKMRLDAVSVKQFNQTLLNQGIPTIEKLLLKPSCTAEQLAAIMAHAGTMVLADFDSLAGKLIPNEPYRSCACYTAGPQGPGFAVAANGNTQKYNYGIIAKQYAMVYAGTHGYTYSSALATQRDYGDVWGGMPEPPITVTTWHNFRYRNNAFEPVTLKDLVKGDYKTILQQELVTALQQRDDLNLDCHATDKLFELTGEKFSLSDEGIILYLPGSSNYWAQLVGLTIPWKRLLPYAKKDSLVQDMVK